MIRSNSIKDQLSTKGNSIEGFSLIPKTKSQNHFQVVIIPNDRGYRESESLGNLRRMNGIPTNSIWHSIGPLRSLKGSRALIHVSDSQLIVVILHQDSVRAIDAVCPHSGGPLHLGDIEDLFHESHKDCYITCPWHAFRYSLLDGSSPEDEDHEARIYETRIVDNQVVEIQLDDGLLIDRIEWIPEPGSESLAQTKEAFLSLVISTPNSTTKSQERSPETLAEWASLILQTPDARAKVSMTHLVAEKWNTGEICEVGTGNPPDLPPRPQELVFISPALAGKRGKGGTEESRIAILHALANIEQWAIDLAWDLIARFPNHPKALYTDFVKIASEEAHHFQLLVDRLEALGSYYGALPVHGSLWDSAMETRHDILARLAIVHMVHEARGLDVNPKTIQKFVKAQDVESVKSLERIHSDEIGHVAIGQKWFTILCHGNDQGRQERDRYDTFHTLVRQHYHGLLKPPFNEQDRQKAGLDPAFYLPLSKKET